jgi:hypothetical protein
MMKQALCFASLFLSARGNNYDVCPLCKVDGHQPQGYGTFYMDGQVITCNDAFQKELKLPEANCTAWQNRGDELCGCAAEPPVGNDCTLCQGGDSLPQGLLAGIPGTTCAQLQVDAKRDLPDRCPVWQQTMGVYCGCDNDLSDNFCSLCGEGFAFDPSKMVDGLISSVERAATVNNKISCGELQFIANVPGSDYTCEQYKFIFDDKCCDAIEDNDLDEIDGALMKGGAGVITASAIFSILVLTNF